tara:strand:- start:340 stop:528 length:189 start_codon:yes stop_codon:yes gene_type:complete
MKAQEQAKITLLTDIIDNGHIDDNTLVHLCDDNNFSDSIILRIISDLDKEDLKAIRQENNNE